MSCFNDFRTSKVCLPPQWCTTNGRRVKWQIAGHRHCNVANTLLKSDLNQTEPLRIVD